MIKHIVTNERLDAALQELITNSNFYYSQVQDYFSDLYITGCRSNEPLFPELWKVESDEITLKTLKTGEKRTFNIDSLSRELVDALIDQERPYGGLSQFQVDAEFKRHFKLCNLHCGNKAVQTYAFRYNRARIAFEESKSIDKVMEYMGWKNPLVASGYVNNTLREVFENDK